MSSTSKIRKVSYEKETGTLVADFADGETYLYYDVPPPIYQSFVNAGSTAEFFDENIRRAYRSARATIRNK
jgi:hypothetical protein